jgi:hypothetical protein
MWQELAVGIIVLFAALYTGAKYLPAGWRRALVHRLSKGGGNSRLVTWLVNVLDTSASCGSGCNSCNTCEPAEPTPPAGKGRVIKIHERR